MRALAAAVGLLALAAPAAAQDLVFDNGEANVLDSLDLLPPDPDGALIEVRDGPGGAPTSLDVATGSDFYSLAFHAYGGSAITQTAAGFAGYSVFDDASLLIAEDSSVGDPSSFLASDRSVARIRDTVYFGTARGQAQVFLEPGFDAFFGSYRAFDESITLVMTGNVFAPRLSGSAQMTVLGGGVGLDDATITDDAVLVIDGGALDTSYGVEVDGRARVDIHSHAAPLPTVLGGYSVAETGMIRLFGSDFLFDGVPVAGDLGAEGGERRGFLEGVLASGDSIRVELVIRDQGIVRLVPEPATALLLAFALAAATLPGRARGRDAESN